MTRRPDRASLLLVSLAAVFSVVTQRQEEERCVTTLKTAARETTLLPAMQQCFSMAELVIRKPFLKAMLWVIN